MADTTRLTDGVDTVNFSPLLTGYRNPEFRVRVQYFTMDGSLRQYELGAKQRENIPINNMTAANAAIVIAWWQAGTLLTWTSDLINAAGVTVGARIINETRPMQMMGFEWKGKHEAELILHEVSSSSFSSSSSSSSLSSSSSSSASESSISSSSSSSSESVSSSSSSSSSSSAGA